MRNYNEFDVTNDNGSRSYRETCGLFRDSVATLEQMYRDDLQNDAPPSHTVQAFAGAVGDDMARAVIATLVNRSAWDGRISKRNAEWAANIGGAFDEESADRMWIFTNVIHMSHLDQMADAARKMA